MHLDTSCPYMSTPRLALSDSRQHFHPLPPHLGCRTDHLWKACLPTGVFADCTLGHGHGVCEQYEQHQRERGLLLPTVDHASDNVPKAAPVECPTDAARVARKANKAAKRARRGNKDKAE